MFACTSVVYSFFTKIIFLRSKITELIFTLFSVFKIHYVSVCFSESDSDDEEAYGDALEEPATKEGTLKWAERWKNSYSQRRNSDSAEYASSSSDQSSYYDSSDGEY